VDDLWPHLHFAGGLLVIAGLSTVLAVRVGARLGWLPLWALVRAAAQLAVVALILRGVLDRPSLVLAFVALMLLTASWTSGTRLTGLWHRRRCASLGVLAGAAVALGLILALRLVELEARYVIATAGIVIGAAMTAATQAGRRFLHGSEERWGEVEAWLAMGASPRLAHRDIAEVAIRESVLPNLDQTKSTGLVTLPGAFVGALFGGASPVEAARFQLVVLAGIALAILVTATVVTELASRTSWTPVRPGA